MMCPSTNGTGERTSTEQLAHGLTWKCCQPIRPLSKKKRMSHSSIKPPIEVPKGTQTANRRTVATRRRPPIAEDLPWRSVSLERHEFDA
jgi:hypothetical protein